MHFSEAINIEDLREIARRRLPRFVFDYVDGGAEDERTLRRNCDVFAQLRFRPRTLVDVSRRDLTAPASNIPQYFDFPKGICVGFIREFAQTSSNVMSFDQFIEIADSGGRNYRKAAG